MKFALETRGLTLEQVQERLDGTRDRAVQKAAA
jgi:hypothetical protein